MESCWSWGTTTTTTRQSRRACRSIREGVLMQPPRTKFKRSPYASFDLLVGPKDKMLLVKRQWERLYSACITMLHISYKDSGETLVRRDDEASQSNSGGNECLMLTACDAS